jgi:Domain of unknown function (DUF1993)
LPIGGQAAKFGGQAQLMHFALPHFIFQFTTAYAILRYNGIAASKIERDFPPGSPNDAFHPNKVAAASNLAWLAAPSSRDFCILRACRMAGGTMGGVRNSALVIGVPALHRSSVPHMR